MPHSDLLELPYFAGIDIDGLVALIDLMLPRPYPAGSIIMAEGDPSASPLHIATTGRVVVSKRAGPAGPVRDLAQLDAPTLFGEIELFCQIPAVATVRAVGAVDTFVLGRTVFDDLLRARHPAAVAFSVNVARVACGRLAVADEVMAALTGDEGVLRLRQAIFARGPGGTATITP